MTTTVLGNRHSRRARVFGPGKRIPLDRNAKARIMTRARGYLHHMKDGSRKPKGKAYGELSAKYYAVLGALLYGSHNAASGACFPSYETIAENAGCTRSTVYEAIRVLELLGLLTWQNRIERRTVDGIGADLFGCPNRRVRVFRTSNAYTFNDPGMRTSSKSESQPGTTNQAFILPLAASDSTLEATLMRLRSAIRTGASRA